MEEKLSRREKIKRGIIKMPKGGGRKSKRKAAPDPSPQPDALVNDKAMLLRAIAYVEGGGMFPDDAWVLAGGTLRTYERYRQKAAAGHPAYQHIVDELHAAGCRHNHKLVNVAQALSAKKGDPRTIVEIVGRRHKKWSPRQRFEIVQDPEALLIWQMMGEWFGDEVTQQFIREWQLACQGLRGVSSEGGAAEGG